jgi:hypothetical protein
MNSEDLAARRSRSKNGLDSAVASVPGPSTCPNIQDVGVIPSEGKGVRGEAQLLLGDQSAVVELCCVREEALEGGFQGAFVLDALVAVALQGLVILLDRLVGRLNDGASGHGLPFVAIRINPGREGN